MWALDQFAILAQLAADRASWYDVGHYPSTVVCRRILALADWSAEHPAAWRIARLSYECPELSIPELAVCCDLSELAARRALAPANLACEADYQAIACPAYDGAIPPHIRGDRAAYDPDRVSVTYRNGVWLAVYASRRPRHWQCWRLAWRGLTQEEIAEKLGVTDRTIRNYLSTPIKFKKEIAEND